MPRKSLFTSLMTVVSAVCTLAAPLLGEETTSHVTVPLTGTGTGAEENSNGSPQYFFDARSTGFTKDGKQQVFEGDVIAIGARSLVTADKVVIDESKHSLVAEGHVIILTDGQYITGEKIQLWGDTGDIKVTSAVLVINDNSETDRIANEILGYSTSEIEFEAHRKERQKELDQKKTNLRGVARQRSKEGLNVPDYMIHDYARFLEQEEMMSQQENPAFAQMSEARRKTLKKRRDFWEQSRLSDRAKGSPGAAYFKMTGDTLERRHGNDFTSTDGLWTPCHCDKDEEPAWAIRSSKTEVQPGGYATFANSVLEIKGVPVLYLPWLRMPIKDKRQSGLLPPSLSSDAQSGSVYSQPLFIDLGPNKDMTVKTEVFERRGTKLESEFRYQSKQYSGFQLKGAIMQDRLWATQRSLRDDLHSIYLDGLDAANDPAQNPSDAAVQSLSGRDYYKARLRQRSWWESDGTNFRYLACVSDDPVARQQCRNEISSYLRVPENERRGMFKWQGQERLSDRLSFVSTGELYSDRQYNLDLYVPESFQAGFDTGTAEKAINPARAQMHYDGREYYLGLGSNFGDATSRNDRYEGFQNPAVFKAKTRWYKLGSSNIYGNLSTDHYRIERHVGNTSDPESSVVTLPNAWWRRATGSLIAPIASNTAVQVDHFTDLEARYITFDGKQSKELESSIQSLRTGFRFQLPIDGKRPLPDWLGGSNIPGEDGTRNIQHLMNWAVTLTARPSVVRRGAYGDPHGPLNSVAEQPMFMKTDINGESDDNIKPEDFMTPYQLVTFETTHRWKIYNEMWKRIEGKNAADEGSAKKVLSYEERARRELLYSMDHPVKKDSDMFSDDQTKWFINRYQLLESDYQEPVTFGASITYDRLKELRRKEEGITRENRPWNEPTSTLGISAAGWGLNESVQYNLYDKVVTRNALTLTPPGFFDTNVSLGYTVTQAINAVGDTFTVTPTREKSVQVVTSLTKPIYTTYTWGQKQIKDTIPDTNYQQKISLIYASPSKCWGLGFSREKGYSASEMDATYVLQLNIIFMGQQRDLPDMSPQFTRELGHSS